MHAIECMHAMHAIYKMHALGGAVAEGLALLTCVLDIPGSNPSSATSGHWRIRLWTSRNYWHSTPIVVAL